MSVAFYFRTESITTFLHILPSVRRALTLLPTAPDLQAISWSVLTSHMMHEMSPDAVLDILLAGG